MSSRLAAPRGQIWRKWRPCCVQNGLERPRFWRASGESRIRWLHQRQTVCPLLLGRLIRTTDHLQFKHVLFFLFFFYQSDISGCFGDAAEWIGRIQLLSGSIKHSVLGSDASWLRWRLFGFALSCDTSGSLQLLVFGSSALGSNEHLHWSHMAAFAWWGFIALKMPKNVSQLTFSMHERARVCVCVFLSSFLQNKLLFAASLREESSNRN